MKKLSIGSWAFLFNQEQPTNDFHAVVHKLQHLGYQGVELGSFAPHPNPDSHDTHEKRDKLRKMVLDHRLEFSGFVPDLWVQKLWTVEDQGPFLGAFEKNVIFAYDLGIKTIRVDTVDPARLIGKAGVEPKLLFERCASAFDAAAKTAAHHGVAVAWAFEPAFALNTPAEIVALVDAVRALGNPNFGVLFNTCDAHRCTGGNSVALLQSLKGKIAHIHLADTDGTLNAHGRSTRVPLGQGVLNFDLLIPELAACGVADDWWCVDLGFVPDAWTAAADARRFLDKLRHKCAG